MKITNTTRNADLATSAWSAKSFWSRMVGLLGRSSLGQGEGLLIEPCSSVHTAFMRFRIDVIYIDKSRRVIKTVPAMRAYRMSAVWRGGHAVIELPAGVIEQTGTTRGDALLIEP